MTAYAWRQTEGRIEIKVKPFTDEAAALSWLKHSKMPCKDLARTPEDEFYIRQRLWNHE